MTEMQKSVQRQIDKEKVRVLKQRIEFRMKTQAKRTEQQHFS